MRAVVVVVLALSTLAAADTVAVIGQPERLVAKPLEVGQWVRYRERVGSTDVGTVMLMAVDRAACGMQFLAVLEGSQTQQWMFCVDDDHHLVKAALDGKLVVLRDHAVELDALLTRVLPPQFAGTFTREDITVPAGYFQGTQRKDGATTTWLHPEVPLGAVVRVKAGDREDVLVEYGTSGARTARARLVKRNRPDPFYVDFAFGWGGLSGVGAGQSGRLDLFGATEGIVLSRSVDAMISFGDGRSNDADPTLETHTLTLTGGPRIWPFREKLGAHRAFDPASLFVQATVGYARITTMDAVGNGVAVSPAIGWQLQRMRDWATTLTVFDAAALYNGNVGFRNEVGVTAAIELWLQ